MWKFVAEVAITAVVAFVTIKVVEYTCEDTTKKAMEEVVAKMTDRERELWKKDEKDCTFEESLERFAALKRTCK